jgi:hypothetical protein
MLNQEQVAAQIERDEKSSQWPDTTKAFIGKLQSKAQAAISEWSDSTKVFFTRLKRETQTAIMVSKWPASAKAVVTRLKRETGAAISASSDAKAYRLEIGAKGASGASQRQITVEFEKGGILSCKAGWRGEQSANASYCTGFPLESDVFTPRQMAKRSDDVVAFVKRELNRSKLSL